MTRKQTATSHVVERRQWRSELTIRVLLLLAGAGCAGNDGHPEGDAHGRAAPENAEAQVERAGAGESMVTETRSGHYLLGLEDLARFQRGKPKDEILNDVQWRGNFEMATQYKGKCITAISYAIASEPLGEGAIGDDFWAVFVDDKFEKVVPWPSKAEWATRRVIKVGDFRLLIEAFESDPLKFSELKASLKVDSETPAQVDPGLTAVWLRLREGIEAAHQRDLKRNAVLRDQFNAARLSLGMSVAEVEGIVKAKPIDSAAVQAGSVNIYGSTESLSAFPLLHYSNILVLIVDGRVSGIYSGTMVPGGKHGLEQMRQWFVDLPPWEHDE